MSPYRDSTGQSRPQGQLYIISAPSGAGKTSLVNSLVEAMSDIEVSVSYTTRPQRNGEQDDVHYHFIDQAAFDAMLRRNAFLEHARVFDYHYGTSRDDVVSRMQQGVDVILEIDWQGARQIRQSVERSIGIFILPPSREVLVQRLRRRGRDTPEVIERRMRDAVNEMSHYNEYDYLIVNDDFDQAVAELRAVVTAQRLSQGYQAVRYSRLVDDLLRQPT